MLTEKIEQYCFPEQRPYVNIKKELNNLFWYLHDTQEPPYWGFWGRQCAIVKDNTILLCFGVREHHHNRYVDNYVYLLDSVGKHCIIIPWEKLSEYDEWANGEKLKKEKEAKEKEEQEKMEKFSKLQIIIISKLA
jgi:hypothetical protein